MVIEDLIYGKFDIQEDVISELLQDPTVLRLKTVQQGGTTAYINGYAEYSRFDHSVGAMLLVRHLGASVDEQVAALLHDISHTAFSHIIDFVYKKNTEQNYHETIKENMIVHSKIPVILEKHSIDLKYVLDEQKFLLLERHQPALCADRVDYALRCLFFYLKKHTEVKHYYASLMNHENEIIFNNEAAAIAFAKDFLEMDKQIFTNPRNVTAYFVMADAIRKALDKNYITEEDFLKSDVELLLKLRSTHDEEIHRLLNHIHPGMQVEIVQHDYDYALQTKVRYVNPKFIKDKKVFSVLDVNKELQKEIEEYSKQRSRLVYVKIINH